MIIKGSSRSGIEKSNCRAPTWLRVGVGGRESKNMGQQRQGLMESPVLCLKGIGV